MTTAAAQASKPPKPRKRLPDGGLDRLSYAKSIADRKALERLGGNTCNEPNLAADLARALASLLRVTHDPDLLHPAWKAARDRAAAAYQRAVDAGIA